MEMTKKREGPVSRTLAPSYLALIRSTSIEER